jgi:protein-tyrosine-phosphatase/predicted ATP-grasp superfamily ATP-dependent carboligase
MVNIARDRVLLIGAGEGACWSVAKSLSEYGLAVDLIHWEDHPIKLSRYIRNLAIIHSPFENISDAASALLALLAKRPCEFVIPINDASVELLRYCEPQMEQAQRILGWNETNAYRYAHNKYDLIKASNEAGLMTPKSHLIRKLEELNRPDQFKFPVMVKPVSTCVISDGRLLCLSVRRAHCSKDLVDIVREYIGVTALIIQDIIPGFGVGFNILSRRGTILNHYCHRRINEGYDSASTYRESCPAEEYFDVAKIEKLVSHIGWNGVAMFEFKVNNGVPYVMEMNGRFWGSIEVGIKAGYNFPVQLYELEALDKWPIAGNHRRVKVRNLQKDFLLAFRNFRKNRSFFSLLSWSYEVCKGAFEEDQFIEDSIADDFGFRIKLWYLLPKQYAVRASKKLSLIFIRGKKERPPVIRGQRITFICYGNICRSPFAEYYARKHFTGYTFSSFGMYHIERRLPPTDAVEAASRKGIDTNLHYSRQLRHEDIEDIDLFIVMDKQNWYDLTHKYPSLSRDKIYYLDSKKQILDPYKKSAQFYDQIFHDIILALNDWFEGKQTS